MRYPDGRRSTGLALLAVLVAALLALAGPSDAQILYGSVVGNVADSSGAAVPGATVTLINTNTNLARETTTGPEGIYRFVNVQPGTYKVRVSLTGFKEYVKDAVPVASTTVTRVDVALEVGALTETITVQSETSLLQTDTGDVHSQLTSKEITSLPLGSYRNYQSLVNLVPGATPAGFQNAITDSPERALDDERQRHGPQQQQHQARRRHQHLRLAAAPRGLHRAGGHGGHGQRDDRQLRRRAGDGRRRLRHRPHQVRHERLPRHRLLAARGPEPAGPQLGQLGRQARQQAEHRRRHPRRPHPEGQAVLLRVLGGAVHDVAEHPDGDAPDRGHARRRLQLLRHHDLRPGHRQRGRHGPHAVPEQHHPRQPDQLDRGAAPVAAAPAERRGHVQQLHRHRAGGLHPQQLRRQAQLQHQLRRAGLREVQPDEGERVLRHVARQPSRRRRGRLRVRRGLGHRRHEGPDRHPRPHLDALAADRPRRGLRRDPVRPELHPAGLRHELRHGRLRHPGHQPDGWCGRRRPVLGHAGVRRQRLRALRGPRRLDPALPQRPQLQLRRQPHLHADEARAQVRRLRRSRWS